MQKTTFFQNKYTFKDFRGIPMDSIVLNYQKYANLGKKIGGGNEKDSFRRH